MNYPSAGHPCVPRMTKAAALALFRASLTGRRGKSILSRA